MATNYKTGSSGDKKQSKQDLHASIMDRARDACEDDLENREQALDDLRFLLGGDYQWDPDVLRERRGQGLPVITIPQLPKFVRQVTNDARKNRPGIKVRAVDDESDPETAAVLEGRTRHIEDQSEAVSKAYIPAVGNAAACGIGHWRINLDYAKGDPFARQEISIKGMPNALSVLWDPLAKDPTRADARYCFVFDDMAEEEFEEKYPDADPADFSHDYLGFWRDYASKTVRVAEYWCKETVTKKFGRTQDGKVFDVTKYSPAMLPMLGVTEVRPCECTKVVSYIVSGGAILSGPHEFPGENIPIVAVIGEETYVGNKCVRSGVVRHAKDAQRLYNYWRSARAEQIAMQPKSPFVVAAEQIKGYEDVWKAANRRNLPVLPYQHVNNVPPPQRSMPAPASLGMTEEIILAAEELQATTGIYAAKLGQASNETSGRAIRARQEQSDTTTLHYPDNLALSIRHTGRIVIDCILATHDVEETLRLLNEDGTEKWARVNALVMGPEGPYFEHDLSIGKYDVTVQTGPSYSTRRMEAADTMLQFIQTVPDSAQFVMDIVAKNFDWPGSDEIAKRFRTMLMKQHPELVEKGDEEEPPPPSPADQMNAFAMQLELRSKDADARKAEADAEKSEMESAKTALEIADMAAAGGPIELEAKRASMNALAKASGAPANGGGPSANHPPITRQLPANGGSGRSSSVPATPEMPPQMPGPGGPVFVGGPQHNAGPEAPLQPGVPAAPPPEMNFPPNPQG